MITSISNVKQNVASNGHTSLKQSKTVTFTGISTGLLKGQSNIVREISNPVIKIIKRILGKAELPFSKKPLTANATLTHFLPDGTPIKIPMPELKIKATKVLDGSNILRPDAADAASKAADTLSTKAAIADVVSGGKGSADAVSSGLDAVAAKSDVTDAVTTGVDAIVAKTDAVDTADTVASVVGNKSVVTDVIDMISNVVDKIV